MKIEIERHIISEICSAAAQMIADIEDLGFNSRGTVIRLSESKDRLHRAQQAAKAEMDGAMEAKINA